MTEKRNIEKTVNFRCWMTVLFLSALLMVFFAGTGMAQDEKAISPAGMPIVQSFGNVGKINWTEAYIEVVGRGTQPKRYLGKPNARPLALRAAKTDAGRRLLSIIKEVPVSSEAAVKDYLSQSNDLQIRLEGIAKGARVVKRGYSPEAVEVTLRLPLYGEFSRALISLIPGKRNIEMPVPAASTVNQPVGLTSAPPAVVYTGLVIDARGLQVRPALLPKVVDESGNEVYGLTVADRKIAVAKGIAGYAGDPAAARSHSRVADNPFAVKGLKAEGFGKSNIVVGNADAQYIRAAGNQSFLRKCRVMIILD